MFLLLDHCKLCECLDILFSSSKGVSGGARHLHQSVIPTGAYCDLMLKTKKIELLSRC